MNLSKIILLLVLSASSIIISCNKKSQQKSKSNIEEKLTPAQTKEKINTNSIDLKQNGDYITLFKLENGNCSFINASDIAIAVNISENSIKDISANGRCNYEITLNDHSLWTLSLQWFPYSKNEITKEIKNYTEEDSPLKAQISNTGDTYLCIHPFNSFLMIFNNNYDGTIQIKYCPVSDYRKLTGSSVLTEFSK